MRDVIQMTPFGLNAGLVGAVGTARDQSHGGEADVHPSQDLQVLYAGGDAGLGGGRIEGDRAMRGVNAVPRHPHNRRRRRW